MKKTKRLLTELKLTIYETKKIVSSITEDKRTELSDLKDKLNKLGFDEFGDKSVDDIEINKEK
tara:strand:+ start:323 stop:511 length:189 start_codon:yes stop_codon:yes gene_type:complete